MSISCDKIYVLISSYLSLWPWPSLELAITGSICVSLVTDLLMCPFKNFFIKQVFKLVLFHRNCKQRRLRQTSLINFRLSLPKGKIKSLTKYLCSQYPTPDYVDDGNLVALWHQCPTTQKPKYQDCFSVTLLYTGTVDRSKKISCLYSAIASLQVTNLTFV